MLLEPFQKLNEGLLDGLGLGDKPASKAKSFYDWGTKNISDAIFGPSQG